MAWYFCRVCTVYGKGDRCWSCGATGLVWHVHAKIPAGGSHTHDLTVAVDAEIESLVD